MIMWQKRFGALLGSVIPLFGIIISLGYGHMAMPANAMPNMASDKTNVSQCQSSCGIAASELGTVPQAANPQYKEPIPFETHQLGFMGVGWSLVLLFSFYLVWHLRWEPPDLTLLHAVYRI
jgi:Na+/melibiose symporter-like transporter